MIRKLFRHIMPTGWWENYVNEIQGKIDLHLSVYLYYTECFIISITRVSVVSKCISMKVDYIRNYQLLDKKSQTTGHKTFSVWMYLSNCFRTHVCTMRINYAFKFSPF